MVYKIISGLVLAFALTMCSKPKTIEQVENRLIESDTFTSVYDTLDQMRLPVTLTWEKWDSLYHVHVEKYGLGIGENITDHAFARLVEREKFKAFVFVSIDETGSPVIITFDKNGNRIDAFGLLGDIASNDPGKWTEELSIINSDLTIQFIDSVWTYDVDADGGRIENSGKMTTTQALYKITDAGKFEKVR